MAKILRTEQLSVDGDNIRLTATDGNLIINSVSGDDLTQITSTTKIAEDISSLAADTGSVESMLVNVSKHGVYSLTTSNLATGSGSSVQTITLVGQAFVSTPTITATLVGGVNDPIMAMMVSDISETATTGVYQVTFQFSDELPENGGTGESTSYKLNILANVNAGDQDLDTIVDSVDSDRDGDGTENSLDYDPDDSSVASFSDTICGYNVRVGGTNSSSPVSTNGGIAFILVDGTTAQAEALRDQWNQSHPIASGRSLDIKTFTSNGDEYETLWGNGGWYTTTVPYTSHPALRHSTYNRHRQWSRDGTGKSYSGSGGSISSYTAKSTECAPYTLFAATHGVNNPSPNYTWQTTEFTGTGGTASIFKGVVVDGLDLYNFYASKTTTSYNLGLSGTSDGIALGESDEITLNVSDSTGRGHPSTTSRHALKYNNTSTLVLFELGTNRTFVPDSRVVLEVAADIPSTST